MFHRFILTLILFLMHNIGCAFEPSSNYSIVFIHIGEKLPPHLETAVCQARLFNKECSIILIANQKALTDLSPQLQQQDLLIVSCESLPQTPEHIKYRKNTVREKGLWRYSSERFLYLHDLAVKYQLSNIFHLENDNMLYVNLQELLPIFQTQYQGIGATFDSDERCIAGFIYLPNPDSTKRLAAYFAKQAKYGDFDMFVLAHYKDSTAPSVIDHLPIIPDLYSTLYPLKSLSGLTVKNPALFSNHIDLFQSIFDAAAIGQYLGGGDIFYFPSTKPGFINECCIFNPSYFTYQWIEDTEGRRVPYAFLNDKSYRINNLHVHSKELFKFSSKNP